MEDDVSLCSYDAESLSALSKLATELEEDKEYNAKLANEFREALVKISNSPHGTEHCDLKKIADEALGLT